MKKVPHEFVLEALTPVHVRTGPLFSCVAVYVGEKIVLALRDRPTHPADNGVWIATTEAHHQSLRRELPCMRPIQLFEGKVAGWQILPADAPDFEESALRVCEMIVARDSRIGKPVPNRARK